MNFKKYSPFIIPAISLLLVLFLAFRWYNLRTQRDKDEQLQEVKIEDLTAEEEIVIGSPDTSTVQLEPENDDLVSGQIRYRLDENRVLFNVAADLPQDETVTYQVWVSSEDQEFFQKAFVLQYNKGGYTGSASLLRDELPLEIVVTREMNPGDQEIEQELLRGVIQDEDTDVLDSETDLKE